MIDWDLAISTGVRFARQGPQVSLADARAVVAELRGLTAVVQQPVREVTGLTSQVAGGPVAVVYPEAVWYTYVDRADIDEIIEEHLQGGRVVERLRI